MAERLKREQPTSSIANALNLGAVRAATEPQPKAPDLVAPLAANGAISTAFAVSPVMPTVASSAPNARIALVPPAVESHAALSRDRTGEPADIMRQFQLTRSTDRVLKRLMSAYSEATGIAISGSELLRAILHGLERTIELHEREARAAGPFRRSKNDPWLLHKRDELERSLARAFVAAMRAAPAFE